jgi:hypothetical protein
MLAHAFHPGRIALAADEMVQYLQHLIRADGFDPALFRITWNTSSISSPQQTWGTSSVSLPSSMQTPVCSRFIMTEIPKSCRQELSENLQLRDDLALIAK